jgi:putative ABC transport system permease protein
MTKNEIRPPRLAERLLTHVVPEGVAGSSILGDAREEFFEHVKSGSRLSASLWYWKHVVSIVFRFLSSTSPNTNPSPHQDGGWRVRLGTLLDDLRIAVRLLIKKPGFTLAAVVTLGLGIGANTTMFSLVYGVLIEPLPYPEADQLVGVYRIDPNVTGRNPSASQLNNLWAVPFEVYRDWSEMSSAFEDVGAHSYVMSLTLTGGDRPERVQGVMATSGMFASLRTPPALGRTFNVNDDQLGAPGLAVLSHGLWQRRFGSDPTVLGRQLTLSGLSYQVVGVMPPQFDFPSDGVEVWVTFEDERKSSPERSGGYLQVIARTRPGLSLQRAQLDLDAVALRIGELHPEEVEHGIGLFPRKSLEVANVQAGLVLLLGAVSLVLLIACANIASLLLVRATERRRELGVRMALGAGHVRLLVQHLSESVVLSVAGGFAGCVLAVLSIGPFKAAFPGGLPRADGITIDYRLLLFAATLSVLTGLLTGMLPAARAIRTPVAGVLQEGSRGSTGGKQRNRTQAALVVTEIALAFVLLVGAGLLIRSLARLTSVEHGFEAENLLTMGVSLPAQYRESDEASLVFFREFSERLRAIPGVRAVGGANQMPFVGGWSSPPAVVETSHGFVDAAIHETTMDSEYFSTMGIPVITGRGFTSGDSEGSELVTVVSEAMVSRYWPDESPLGRRIGRTDAAGDSVWITVVGVVGDVRYRLNQDAFPSYHLPLAQWPNTWYQWVILRTEIDPGVITPAVQEALAEIDPEVPIQVLQVDERIRNSTAVAGPRFGIFVLSCLAGLAALLAFIGVYGVLAYTVQQRAREIGIRIALGAGAKNVFRTLLGHGLMMAGIGLGIGLALAFGASRVMSSLLFEVSPTDPMTLLATSVLVIIAGLAASYFPARRATKVDPVEVLRQE